MFVGWWVDLDMVRYFTLLLFIGLVHSQETEKNDSTFALLKSGEIKQVQKTSVDIEFGEPLPFCFHTDEFRKIYSSYNKK